MTTPVINLFLETEALYETWESYSFLPAENMVSGKLCRSCAKGLLGPNFETGGEGIREKEAEKQRQPISGEERRF